MFVKALAVSFRYANTGIGSSSFPWGAATVGAVGWTMTGACLLFRTSIRGSGFRVPRQSPLLLVRIPMASGSGSVAAKPRCSGSFFPSPAIFSLQLLQGRAPFTFFRRRRPRANAGRAGQSGCRRSPSPLSGDSCFSSVSGIHPASPGRISLGISDMQAAVFREWRKSGRCVGTGGFWVKRRCRDGRKEEGVSERSTCRSAAGKVPGEDHGAGCGRNRSTFCAHCGCVPDVLNRHLLEISDVIARVVSASAGDGMLTEVQRILEEGGPFGSAVFRSAMGPDLIEDVRAFFSDYADKVLAPTVRQDPAVASSL